MSQENTNSRLITCAASGLLIVLILVPAYLGTYYALLVDRVSFASPPAPGVPFDLMLEPVYRTENSYVKAFLEPAHQLDRRLRPEYWPE